MNKKKVYNSQFKIKVALEALRENNTTLEVSKRYQVHIQTLRDWIRIVRKNGHSIFDDKREKYSSQSNDKELLVLRQKIGELIIENDFLKKKLDCWA
jgi:transposase